MGGVRKTEPPPVRLSVELCPWCKGHVDDHSWRSLVTHSEKWRTKVGAK